MHTTRGAALLAAAALTVSGLAACGDEGEPSESSSTASPSAVGSSSSSESSDPESTSSSKSEDTKGDGKVVELPAAAKKRTKAGAAAFNEFYQDQAGEALKSGEIRTLEQYAKSCDACATYRKGISDRAAKGVTMNKNPNSVSEVSATKRSDSGYKVTLTIKADEYREVLKDGSLGRTAKPVTYKLITDTQWQEGHWVIRDSVLIQ